MYVYVSLDEFDSVPGNPRCLTLQHSSASCKFERKQARKQPTTRPTANSIGCLVPNKYGKEMKRYEKRWKENTCSILLSFRFLEGDFQVLPGWTEAGCFQQAQWGDCRNSRGSFTLAMSMWWFAKGFYPACVDLSVNFVPTHTRTQKPTLTCSTTHAVRTLTHTGHGMCWENRI